MSVPVWKAFCAKTDKKYMAKDVHSALIKIAEKEGKMKKKDAENYINQTLMKDEHRYLRDVY